MQNNMRTIHVGIFHLFQKKHAGYKNPDHLDATLVANSTELQKSRKSEFSYYFSFQGSVKSQASLCIFVNSTKL